MGRRNSPGDPRPLYRGRARSLNRTLLSAARVARCRSPPERVSFAPPGNAGSGALRQGRRMLAGPGGGG